MAEAMTADPAISILQVAERLGSTARRSISAQRSSERLRLACKIAPIRLIPESLSKEILGARDKQQVVGTGVGVKSLILVPGTPEGPDSEKTLLR